MQLSDIDKQIAELQAQKQQLIEKEKEKALDEVMAALEKLNALGFHYELHNLESKPKVTRTRRTGVRDDVLAVISKHQGIKPADIAAELELDDTKGKQAVANALSALKKAGQVTVENREYRAA
jgi:predicted transcriptional regulator